MSSAQTSDLPVVDGAKAQSGGQVLRTALTVSLITQKPFRLIHFREGKSPSGLRQQHLACLRAVETISASACHGADVGATSLEFFPGPVSAGEYLLDVGAESTTLVFQTLFYPLALAGGGELRLRGATHGAFSPSYHYLARVWLPAIRAYGLRAETHLRHAGFWPEGDGEFRASVPPPIEPPTLVELPSRGTLHEMEVISFVGGLPFDVAEKQGRAAQVALREQGIYSSVENLPLPVTRSAGSAVLIVAQFENTFAGFTALGDKGAPPERVGREAAEQVAQFMESAGALEPCLADQLMLPAALFAAGKWGSSAPTTTRFSTERITPHMTAQAVVLEQLLPVEIALEEPGNVSITHRT